MQLLIIIKRTNKHKKYELQNNLFIYKRFGLHYNKRENMKEIRFGFIGAGKIANALADTINHVAGATNYAVAARDLSRAEKFKEKYGFKKAYGSYEEMLQDKDVDAVYISTIHSLHYEHCLLALKYNKPVLCEKSLTTSLKDTEDLYKQFEEKNVILTEALWSSFMPYNDFLRKLVFEDKVIGELKKVTASFNLNIYKVPRIKERSLGGGAILDLGIYPLSFIFRLLGKNYNSMEIVKSKRKNEVDNHDVIVFTYPECPVVKATCKVNSLINKNEAYIYGKDGYIYVNSVTYPTKIMLVTNKEEDVKAYDVSHEHGGYVYEIESFASAVRNNEKQCNEHTAKDSIFIAKVQDLIVNPKK